MEFHFSCEWAVQFSSLLKPITMENLCKTWTIHKRLLSNHAIKTEGSLDITVHVPHCWYCILHYWMIYCIYTDKEKVPTYIHCWYILHCKNWNSLLTSKNYLHVHEYLKPCLSMWQLSTSLSLSRKKLFIWEIKYLKFVFSGNVPCVILFAMQQCYCLVRNHKSPRYRFRRKCSQTAQAQFRLVVVRSDLQNGVSLFTQDF